MRADERASYRRATVGGRVLMGSVRRIIASVVWLTSLLAAAGAHWKPY